MLSDATQKQIAEFNGRPGHECQHKHRYEGTGGVFFQSVGLMRCIHCGGWQRIREPR